MNTVTDARPKPVLVPPIVEPVVAKPSRGQIAGDDPRVPAAAAGDRDAAASLLAELLPRVRNLVRYLVRGDDEVDDLTQAALLEILRALPGFGGRSALTTWADRIAVRETLRRAKQRRRRAAQLQEVSEVLHERTTSPPVQDSYVARRQLAELLDGFPAEQREALVLHHVVGLSIPEIAKNLGVPFDTAKSRLRLGMKRLRKHYGGQRD